MKVMATYTVKSLSDRPTTNSELLYALHIDRVMY